LVREVYPPADISCQLGKNACVLYQAIECRNSVRKNDLRALYEIAGCSRLIPAIPACCRARFITTQRDAGRIRLELFRAPGCQESGEQLTVLLLHEIDLI
jgi:hypothetical protein